MEFRWDELTTSLLKAPYQPGAVGRLGLFEPKRQSTTTANVEIKAQRLALVPDMPRGAPPTPNVEDRRVLVPFRIPHFPIRDTLYADSVQDGRGFGTNSLESFRTVADERLATLGGRLDVTLEHLRLGAVQGEVITAVDRDSGEPLRQVNLFDHFGVAPQPVLDWPILGAGRLGQENSAWEGQLTGLINDLGRRMADEVPGGMLQAVYGFCGAQFFDAFSQHPERRAAFIGFETPATTGPTRGAVIAFRGTTVEEYRGRVGGRPFVASDVCHFLPIGIAEAFVEAYAPADYTEAVNTLALPRYAKSETMPFDKGVLLEAQMNVLPLCTVPRALFTARVTPWQASGPPPAETAAPAAPASRSAQRR